MVVGAVVGFVVGVVVGVVVGAVVGITVGAEVVPVVGVEGVGEVVVCALVGLSVGTTTGESVGWIVEPGLVASVPADPVEGCVVGLSAGFVAGTVAGFVIFTVGLPETVSVGSAISSVGDASVLFVVTGWADTSVEGAMVSPVGAGVGSAEGATEGTTVAGADEAVAWESSCICGLFLSGSNQMNPIVSRIPTTAKSHRRSFFSGGMISFSAKGVIQ